MSYYHTASTRRWLAAHGVRSRSSGYQSHSRHEWIHCGWSVWNGSQRIGFIRGAVGHDAAWDAIPEAWFGDDKTRLKNLHIEKEFTEV